MRGNKIAYVIQEGLQEGIDNVVSSIKSKVSNFFGGWWWWCRNCNKRTTSTVGSEGDPTFSSVFESDDETFDPNAVEFIDVDFEEQESLLIA